MSGPAAPDPRWDDHGDARWDDHWDTYSQSTRANPGQRLRRRLIVRLLGAGAARPGAAILDIGCGSGDLLAHLKARFPEAGLAGVDASTRGLAVAEKDVPGALLVAHDITAGEPPPALSHWASHAVCSEVLEHMDDPARVLAAAHRCLRPGGRLVVTVPGGPLSAFDRHIGHRRHYTRAALGALLEEQGFAVETAAAAGFPAFNLYRLVVLARGRRLIEDVGGPATPAARAAMAVFRALMPLSLDDSPWGWQIAAAARSGGAP